jgi:hypothetical protein
VASFFSKCEQCGNLIPTGSSCPRCRQPKAAEGSERNESSFIDEYRRRQQRHITNFTIYMILMFGTGVVGVLTAVMWFMFIFLGSVLAAFLLIPLNIGLVIMGIMLKAADRLLPTNVNCPSCSVRLDELGLNGGCCPGCHARLK